MFHILFQSNAIMLQSDFLEENFLHDGILSFLCVKVKFISVPPYAVYLS